MGRVAYANFYSFKKQRKTNGAVLIETLKIIAKKNLTNTRACILIRSLDTTQKRASGHINEAYFSRNLASLLKMENKIDSC